MKQINEFDGSTQLAAKQYVSLYLRDSAIRNSHLRFMQVLDNAGFDECRQLAEAIDILLWEYDQRQALEIAEQIDAWAPDHEHWTVMH